MSIKLCRIAILAPLLLLSACKSPGSRLNSGNENLNAILRDISSHNGITNKDLNKYFKVNEQKVIPEVFPKSCSLEPTQSAKSVISKAIIRCITGKSGDEKLNRIDIIAKNNDDGVCMSMHQLTQEFGLAIQPPNPLHHPPNEPFPIVAKGNILGHTTIATAENSPNNCLKEISIFFTL